jgi:hypothetical protein
LYSQYYADFAAFKTAIETCLREMPTTHRAALASLLTPVFRPLKKRSLCPREV